MKALIIGNGGREHALAWKIEQSPLVKKVFISPGNGGTALEEKIENINIDINDINQLVLFAKKEKIDLTIIGPEVPLSKGIVDTFIENKLKVFGPKKLAAQLESSKDFAKSFMERHKIPTAKYKTFTNIKNAHKYINKEGAPIVIKADGLAAGKGVIIANTLNEAIVAINDMLEGNRFGEAGSRVVIEEFLKGEEASFIVMVDGDNILPMATSQDHKARDNADKGPNTGGMGAYSPAPIVSPLVFNDAMEKVIKPTVKAMKAEGIPYTGFLYAGLMIDNKGMIKVLEYNCRFGDPETQPIMMRLKSNLAQLCISATQGTLDLANAEWDNRTALGVVMAANGYPDSYKKGEIINLPIEESNSKIFHAGTSLDAGNITSNGGRVLCATALGGSIKEAQEKAYQLTNSVGWDESYFRTDIGFKGL